MFGLKPSRKVPYEFAGTQMAKMPLPRDWEDHPLRSKLTGLSREADALGQRYVELSPELAIAAAMRLGRKPRAIVDEHQRERARIRQRLIIIQEEIAFVIYAMFDLTEGNLLGGDSVSADLDINAGDRPFCIIRQQNQEGFAVPSEVPSSWPAILRNLWQARINAINASPELRIIEDPHYKRAGSGGRGFSIAQRTATQSMMPLSPGSSTVSNPTSTSTAA